MTKRTTTKTRKQDEKAAEKAYEAKLAAARKERQLHQLYDLQERVRAAVEKGKGQFRAWKLNVNMDLASMPLYEIQIIVDAWVRLAAQDLDGVRLSQGVADREAANRAA